MDSIAENLVQRQETRNMKKLLILFLFSLIVVKSFGTAQIPDRIIYKGDTLLLHSCPLEFYPKQDYTNPLNLFNSIGCFYTACWRNYVATWELVEEELYLTNIRNACYPMDLKGASASFKAGMDKDSIGQKYADLEKLFPKEYIEDKVKADWFSGNIFIQQGKLLHYFHDGFESIYEKEIQLTFENGKLVNTTLFDNSKGKRGKFPHDEKALREFIYSNINRDNLPKTDTIQRRTFVRIVSADDNGKIDSVEIRRGSGNELYDKEAMRVIMMISDWDVIYKRGKKAFMQWTIPVLFDLTEKKEENTNP